MNLISRGTNLIPNSNKKKINIILIIQFFKFLLEMFGIGIIVPIIYFLAKGNEAINQLIDKYELLSIIPERMLSESNLILFILSSVILVFVIKFLFTIFANLYEQKWIETANVQTTYDLFNFYISDTSKLSDRENYNLIRNLTTEINNFYKFFIRGFIQFFSESIKLLGILIFLLIINPKILITGLFVTIGMVLIFYNFFKKKIEIYGRRKTLNSGLLIKHITEGLNSVKEIKLSENPNYFSNLLKIYADENADIQVKFSMLNVYPRQILEILSIVIVCGLIYYLSILFPNQNTSSLFYLGVYIAALFRIIPIVNLLYQSIQQISYSKSSFEVVEKEINENLSRPIFKTIKKNEANNIKVENIIIKDLDFSYDNNNNHNILHNVNLKFEKGKIYCLTGRSGSGKSTFINLLMGFIEPKKGKIMINSDINIHDNLLGWQKNVHYLSQKVFLLNETIKKNIAFSQHEENINETKILESLEKANLLSHIKELDNGIETTIGDDGIKLSGGQKQRLGIARSFYFDKKVMILDEFTSSLDFENENLIFDEILKNKKDKITIIISHSKNITNRSDIIMNVENKKIELIEN
tara:strand:- start:1114 stop:2865 length:1752 start_codon:yes stop_codon:yes gene_type:complete